MIFKRYLYIIPARKNSKGLPGKNVKLLGGKKLISYSIEFALNICTSDDVICISSNDDEVIDIAKQYDLNPPFIRPEYLSSDSSTTFDVIKHALDFYSKRGIEFSHFVLLQPTSPFRLVSDFRGIEKISNESNADMVVSVKIAKESPYFTIFKENENGDLERFVTSPIYPNRQDCPLVYTYNGSIYLIKTNSFSQTQNFAFKRIKKFIMPEERSIDIDYQSDWVLAEYFLNKNNENS